MNIEALKVDLLRDEGCWFHVAEQFKNAYNLRAASVLEAPATALTSPTCVEVKMANQFVPVPGEIWKRVPGFPDYEVSTCGRLRSVTRRQGARASISGGIIHGWVARRRGGKPVAVKVALRSGGRTHEKKLHRLVLEAFVGPCPSGQEGCHNDGNPLNNTLENLRWDTHAENIRDSIRHGTNSKPPVHWGEAHHASKLTDKQVAELRAVPWRRGMRIAMARKYGVAAITIDRLRKGLSRA